MIDFDRINSAALSSARSLLPQIIPGGTYRSQEYVVKNPRRNDQRSGSFKINYKSGQWADFATSDKGGDLVSLLAFVRGVDQADAARELSGMLGLVEPLRNGHNGSRIDVPSRASQPAAEAIKEPAVRLPMRTVANADGKPKFWSWGDEGPPRRQDEVRRHTYRQEGYPVRIKIKNRSGDNALFISWYRVHDNGATGWQAAKPDGYQAVPFVGAVNPFDAELIGGPIFWTEGEKDTDTLGNINMPAFTFGGTGDGLPDGIEQHLVARDLVILADNDNPGREHAEKKASLAQTAGATSVRMVQFPELPEHGDVSDFIANGGTAAELMQRVQAAATTWMPAATSSTRTRANSPDWRSGVIRASDLQRMTFAPVRYVLPGFIAEGTAILAGKPKVGKSWLTLDLCIAVAGNRFTLGVLKPHHGDVLYLALEDNPRRLKRRMAKLLPDTGGAWPERLSLVTDWRRADDGGLADIEEWCKSVSEPTLVVIDTLEKFRPLQNGKTQAYAADYLAISGLQRISSARGIAIVINHHVRKMEADDPFDTVSGTLGLTGAADTILVLRRQSGAVTLHARGRDIEESETALQFDRGACRWTMLGAAADVHLSHERGAIITALSGAGPDGLAVSEIMAATGSTSRGATDTLLFKMKEAGDIVRIKRGIYGLQQDAGKIGQKERNGHQVPENIDETDDLSNLTDLTGGAR